MRDFIGSANPYFSEQRHVPSLFKELFCQLKAAKLMKQTVLQYGGLQIFEAMFYLSAAFLNANIWLVQPHPILIQCS